MYGFVQMLMKGDPAARQRGSQLISYCPHASNYNALIGRNSS